MYSRIAVIGSFIFLCIVSICIASCSCGSSDDESSDDDKAPSDDSSTDDTDDTGDDTVTADDTESDDSADDSDDDTEPPTTTTTTTLPTTTTHGSTSTTTTVPSTTTTTTTTCVDDEEAAMFVEPTTAAIGEAIVFTAVPGLYGTGVQWDLGDGGSSNEWEFLHSYDAAGDYTVNVTIAGSDGAPCSLDTQNSFTVHIEDAADDTTDDDVADDTISDDTADDDAATPLDPDFTFVGGGDALPGSVVVDGSGTTLLFLARANLISYYTTTDGVTWDYRTLTRGVLPRAGAGTDGIVRLAYVDPAGPGRVISSDNSSGSFVPHIVNTDGHNISPDYFDAKIDAGGHTHIVYDDLTLGRLRYATNASGSWTIETMPVPLSFQWTYSIAVDDDGWLHLACIINYRLTHITNHGGTWTTQTVNPVINGRYPAIAVDHDGYVHISFWGYVGPYSHRDIVYVSDRSGSWNAETICDVTAGYDWGCFEQSDVEVDDQGRVNVLYSYFQTWTLEPPAYDAYLYLKTFDPDVMTPTSTALASVDDHIGDDFSYSLSATANREIHIAYKIQDTLPFELYYKKTGLAAVKVDDLSYGAAYDSCYAAGGDGSNHFSYTGTGGFFHASELSGTYSTAHLGTGYYIQMGLGWHYSGDTGGSSHIEVDDTGVAYIGYGWYDATSDMGTVSMDSEIRLTTIDGTSVDTDTLVGSSFYCGGCEYVPTMAMSLDNLHHPHVAFFFWDLIGLRYHDSSHLSELVDDNAGHRPAIIVDPAGFSHIVYLDIRSDTLNYATNLSGAWESKVVLDDIEHGNDAAVSIAVDSDDKHHILFSDDVDPDHLYYAADTSGAWVAELVTEGALSHRHGLAVDSSGVVHIAYFDEATEQIRYAYNDGSGWNHFIVDEGAGQAGIALNEDAGAIRIGYVSWGGLWAAEFPML